MFNQCIGNIARKHQDNIARRIMKCHTLKRLGDKWRNWKYALKEVMINSFFQAAYQYSFIPKIDSSMNSLQKRMPIRLYCKNICKCGFVTKMNVSMAS